jgi:zinc resistance-associated protein
MWKTAAAGAAALVIAGSMIVYAQQRPGFDGPRGYDAPHGYDGPRDNDRPRDMQRFGDWHPSAQDLAAFADARIAALHAGLQLNADQEKSWPSFEQALREVAKMRIERLSAARDEQTPASPIERLQRRADAMTTHGAALKRLADAAAPLYQSLDDAQKRRFAMLARFMRPRDGGGMMMHHRFGSGPGGYGGDEDRGGMHGQGFHMGPHGFGDGMRNPHGMGGMGGRDDDEDYRGPL